MKYVLTVIYSGAMAPLKSSDFDLATLGVLGIKGNLYKRVGMTLRKLKSPKPVIAKRIAMPQNTIRKLAEEHERFVGERKDDAEYRRGG